MNNNVTNFVKPAVLNYLIINFFPNRFRIKVYPDYGGSKKSNRNESNYLKSLFLFCNVRMVIVHKLKQSFQVEKLLSENSKKTKRELKNKTKKKSDLKIKPNGISNLFSFVHLTDPRR